MIKGIWDVLTSRFHRWHYRNPYDRKCKRCERHEVYHQRDVRDPPRLGWWETFNEGTDQPCNKPLKTRSKQK